MPVEEEIKTAEEMAECAECRLPIRDAFVVKVGGTNLHEDCLRCAVCKESLTSSCFTKFGQFYCKADFYRMFGPRCASCHIVFTEEDSVRTIGQSQFHLACFSCSQCGLPLDRGMRVGLDHLGNLLCEEDFLKQDITDQIGGTKDSRVKLEAEHDLDSGFESEISMEDIKKQVEEEDKSFDEDHQEKSDNEDEREGDDKKEGKDGKRRGPRTVPWGTPERTGAGDDLAPSTRTVWMRLDKNDRIQRRRDPPMPREESFVRRISWSTLSKAFEKSRRMASICSLFLRQRLKSLTVVISCDTQLRFFLNPCWNSLRVE